MGRHLVLELADTEGKLLVCSHHPKKGWILENALVVEWAETARGPEGAAERGAMLRDAMKANKVAAGPCGLVIPKQNAIVRTAHLPSSEPAEISEMAHFEAEKFIQFNADRHIVSHGIVRQNEPEGSEVVIAAVDEPVMNQALKVCDEAKLEPLIAEVTSISLARCLAVYETEAVQEQQLLVLSIAAGYTDVAILSHGTLVMARSQPVGLTKLEKDMEKASSEPLQEGDPDPTNLVVAAWIDRLARFVRQTFEAASREHGMLSIGRLYLCGEGSTLPGLVQGLRGQLGLEVVPFNPLEDFQVGKNQVESAYFPGMASALGCIHRLQEEEEHPSARKGRVNLLPRRVLDQQEASERRLLLVLSGMMVVITFGLLFLVFDRQNSYNEMLERRYRQYNRQMEELVDDLREKQDRIAIIETKKSNYASPLLILDRITQFPGIGSAQNDGRLVLTKFEYSGSEEVSVAGTALEVEDISDFISYLRNQRHEGRPIFASIGVQQNSPDELSRGRGQVWTFSFTAFLEPINEVEED